MRVRIIYILAFLLILITVYGIGVFIDSSFKNKEIFQMIIMFALAIVADKIIKKFFDASDG